MADRTPVVLALLADALQARDADSPDDHDLHALADGVALAVDHGAAAWLWPPTSQDDADVEWISNQWKFIDAGLGREDQVTSVTRSLEVRIARRLADVSASLCVRGESMRREAEALWRAASRLLGLDERPVDREPPTYGVRLADSMAEVMCLRADLASMTEQRDEAVRQRDEARRERDKAHEQFGLEAAAQQAETRKPVDDGEPMSIRNIAIAAGARECSLFVDVRSVVVVVAPNPGAHLGTIAEAVLRSVPLDDPRTYVVRSIGAQRQEYVETPEDRLRRHRARWCLHGRPEVECPECSAGYG